MVFFCQSMKRTECVRGAQRAIHHINHLNKGWHYNQKPIHNWKNNRQNTSNRINVPDFDISINQLISRQRPHLRNTHTLTMLSFTANLPHKLFKPKIELCCYLSFILTVYGTIHVFTRSHLVQVTQEAREREEENGNRACAARSCINGHLIKLPFKQNEKNCIHFRFWIFLHVFYHAIWDDTCTNIA